ncbi:MAG: TetR/AcrR family transcriptional regulator [Eubacterium sp.]
MAVYKNGEKTKILIYKTAKDQFFEKGYDKTTLTSISKASDTNTALISYYFKSKLDLALSVYNEYMTATKILTNFLLEKITPNNDLLFTTAVEIRLLTRNMQTSHELNRFLYELNNTNFYYKKNSATVGFFDNVNRRYHLGLDKNQVYAIAVTNYAINVSLNAARFNGILDCTNEFIIQTVFSHFAKLMSFDNAVIQAVLDNSQNISEKIDISVGKSFQLQHH